MARVDRKVVVVTGAAGGMGLASVRALLAEGASVGALGRGADLRERLGELIRAYPNRVLCCTCDVGERQEVEAAVKEIRERWGRLDGLLGCAAAQGPVVSFMDYSDDDGWKVMRTNFGGAWNTAKAMLPAFQEQGSGAIVNVVSTGGLRGWPGLAGYIASKHAVVGLTKTVALECARDGVTVNALCPGPTETPLLDAFAGPGGTREDVVEMLSRTVPVGRVGGSDEIAAVACWLLLSAPRYLTGAVITVDGAQTAGVGEYA